MELRNAWRGALIVSGLWTLAPLAAAPKSVSVQWASPAQAGQVTIVRGTLVSIAGTRVAAGTGSTGAFSTGSGRIEFVVDEPGGAEPLPVLVTVQAGSR